MNRQERFSAPVVGGSSLLVIFAVLCLTVFALLGLTTAQADSRLSEASARAVSAYYEADCKAETVLARLRAGELPDEVAVDGTHYSYTVPVSEVQELQVELLRMEENWKILRWETVSTADWESDGSQSLWDGETIL